MSWRRWKLGLFVGLLLGVFDGGVVAFATKTDWTTVAGLIAYFICKDALNFLKEHPIEKIDFDNTTILTKDDVNKPPTV